MHTYIHACIHNSEREGDNRHTYMHAYIYTTDTETGTDRQTGGQTDMTEGRYDSSKLSINLFRVMEHCM